MIIFVSAWTCIHLERAWRRFKAAERKAAIVAAFDRLQASADRMVASTGALKGATTRACEAFEKAADAVDSASARAKGRLH